MSPRTTTVLCPRLRASRNVSIAFETLFGLALYASRTVISVAASRETRMWPFGDSRTPLIWHRCRKAARQSIPRRQPRTPRTPRARPGFRERTETVAASNPQRASVGTPLSRSSARSSSKRAVNLDVRSRFSARSGKTPFDSRTEQASP